MIAILVVLITVVIAQGGAVYYLVVVLPHRVAQLVAAERAASTAAAAFQASTTATAAAEVARVARELYALAYWFTYKSWAPGSPADVETSRKPERAAASRERPSPHGGAAVIAVDLGPRPGAQALERSNDDGPPRSVTLLSMQAPRAPGEGGGP